MSEVYDPVNLSNFDEDGLELALVRTPLTRIIHGQAPTKRL